MKLPKKHYVYPYTVSSYLEETKWKYVALRLLILYLSTQLKKSKEK